MALPEVGSVGGTCKMLFLLIFQTGALCGSEFVNQHFISWFKEQAGDFQAKCKALGLTPTACIKQASASFEDIKKKFTGPKARFEFVVIHGHQGAAETIWKVTLSR